MLTVNHVTKRYGNFTALEDITITFENGVYGLLAPNGAGKTTLIKMLTTLMFPTNGEILWNGDDIHSLGAAYRDILGYLPQEFGYYKNCSPRQFLRYLAALKGLDRKLADRRIEKLLNLVGLADAVNQKMKKFSGGMIQRVGIAQAMLNDPAILILDEPTAGLDPKERVRFRNIIHSLAKDRIVILSTHIVSDIETIAGSVIMLKDHALYCCEPTEEICRKLAGRVFEIDQLEDMEPHQMLLSERHEAGKTRYRIMSERTPASGKAVLPNLEDVFLHVYQDTENTGELYETIYS